MNGVTFLQTFGETSSQGSQISALEVHLLFTLFDGEPETETWYYVFLNENENIWEFLIFVMLFDFLRNCGWGVSAFYLGQFLFY